MSKDILLNIANLESRLPVTNLLEDAKAGYEMFRVLMEENFWDIRSITSLRLSSAYNSSELLPYIESLRCLRSLTFRGDRRNKDHKTTKWRLWNGPVLNSDSKNGLVYLDLSFNEMVAIPEWVYELHSLRHLRLDFCGIKSLRACINQLGGLEEVHLAENNISTLPDEFSCLTKLKVVNFSNNNFVVVPDQFFQLFSLQHIDLSENDISGCLPSFQGLDNLGILKLRNNNIDDVDERCLDLPSLHNLDLRYNKIEKVSALMLSKEFVSLDGNPFERSGEASDKEKVAEAKSVRRYHMEFNRCCVNVKPGKGGCFVLPCGVQVTIPRTATEIDILISIQVLSVQETDFHLNELDELLSNVVELTPSGQSFKKPVELSIPFTFERNDEQAREIVIRVVSKDGTVEDLRTAWEDMPSQNGKDSSSIAKACTLHFSKFAVVSRLLETTTIIKKDHGQLVFAPAFPQTKLLFQPGSVEENTKITVKVISVKRSIVQEFAQSITAAASCILSVDVLPSGTVFQKPVTVRMALPDELLGKSFHHNALKLLKCPKDSSEWIDVTAETVLHISALDVSFETDSFSKFMLVTEVICGVAREIYRRLRTHQVQFIAMQKRSLPTQIIAQCVMERKVSCRVQQLIQFGYVGEDATTPVQCLVEGTSFRIKVIGDLKIQEFDDKLAKHVQEKVVVCKFFSQYPPDKKGFTRFFVEPTGRGRKQHTGFISFFKMGEAPGQGIAVAKPSHDGEEEKQNEADFGRDSYNTNIHMQSKEVDTNEEADLDSEDHLGDVPIVLKNGDELDPIATPNKPTELDFGNLGISMFREDHLQLLAYKIGSEWREIGTFLGIPFAQLERISLDFPGNTQSQVFQMLRRWALLNGDEDDCMEQLTKALSLAGREDLVLKVTRLYEDGRKEFHDSVKRRRGIRVPSDWGD